MPFNITCYLSRTVDFLHEPRVTTVLLQVYLTKEHDILKAEEVLLMSVQHFEKWSVL